MSRIGEAFRRTSAEGGKALITYLMAGDPSLDRTEELVLEMERAGADIIELGVPFTDPLADGPTIQRAAVRALDQGVTLTRVLGLVRRLRRKSQIPIVLMGYYNPIFRYGEERFVTDAVKAGVDGIIVPDLTPDEAGTLIAAARARGLDTIFLLAPTSTEDRIRTVTRAATGFVYYVSITGITGARLTFGREMKEKIDAIRRNSTHPVAVGFGVSSADDARRLAGLADGVIVGSALVKRIEAGRPVAPFVRALKKALQ